MLHFMMCAISVGVGVEGGGGGGGGGCTWGTGLNKNVTYIL